ncbi:MAG: single-stranded-DNA-specific exonuclease RecJ [Eubacteriales bacterium]|nr:single-stranded-DNA-specific exonuclease RecJ [Eubacteriales bacterium]
MKKKWMVYAKRADFQKISEKFGIDQVTARIIRNRDITGEEEIRRYLKGNLEDLFDRRLLPHIEEAAELVIQKIREGRHIRIVGDYDIDGVCATYILYRGLIRVCGALSSGAVIDYVIPERIRDGYGINRQIIERAADEGVDTILTCDNGIAAIEELAFAKERGLTVIITDHHDVRIEEEAQKELLPPADVIVDPKLAESRYPTDNICGAVVGWKLIGLLYELCGIPEAEWQAFLEFAAVATVGDVMELRGENRIIVKNGLTQLNAGGRNMGLRKLIEACGIAGKPIGAYHIGFVIGPCINAGGRLETAEAALRLFLSDSEKEAEKLAAHLRLLNDERKDMTEAGVREAVNQAEQLYAKDPVLVIYLPDLHESLAGIVAGRIRERFGKPCFVITDAKEGCKGSGRSIEKYHMFQGLCGVSALLSKFGGHPMAAGLSLPRENVDAFRREINRQCSLTEEDFVGTLWIDAAMPLPYISGKLVSELSLLEPFGNGNEKPVFAVKGVRLEGLTVLGKNRNVLKCRATDGSGYSMSAVMFGEADRMKEELSAAALCNIVYYPEINEYNGFRRLQLVISEYQTDRTGG